MMMIAEERDKKADRQMEKLKTKLKEGRTEEVDGQNKLCHLQQIELSLHLPSPKAKLEYLNGCHYLHTISNESFLRDYFKSSDPFRVLPPSPTWRHWQHL